AHQGNDGAIMITGTGSCGYSYVNGKETMVGGHGFPHGDKGSGAWLGLQAVKKVLLSLDGLAVKSLMNNIMLNKLDCSNALEIVEAVAKKTANFYATLAAVVFEAAADNDELALSIVNDGASYIGQVARRLQRENPPRMSLIGGLNKILINYLDHDVAQLLSQPISAPEIGAVLYAKQQTQQAS
ncbi:MAG: ATPase, partial [Gammaproteobacteria bacterium]|nr:ATPase [Gammaproteobacteria bacterium]